MVALLDDVLSLAYFITVTDFDLLWALADPDNNSLRRAAFNNCYSMTPGVEIIDEEEVPVWRLGFTYWTAFALFATTSAFLCEELCPQVNFHNLH